MTFLPSLSHLKLGPYADANTFTGTPLTLYSVDVVGTPGLAFDKNFLPLNTIRSDGKMRPSKVGPRVSGGTIQTHLKGRETTDGGNAGAGTEEADIETHYLLSSVFGGPGTGSQAGEGEIHGSATAEIVAALSSGDPSVDVTTSDASFDIGKAILFGVAAGASEIVAREITAKPGANQLTLDRGNWAGSTTGGTIRAGITYALTPSLANQIHFGIAYDLDSSDSNKVYETDGCAVGELTLSFPDDGGVVTADWTISGTSWDDDGSDVTYAQNGGTEICHANGSFHIGSTDYAVSGLQIVVTCELAARVSPGGANGFLGYVVTKRSAQIKGKILKGSLDDEAAQTLHETTFTGSATVDMAGQSGNAAGSACYWRAPAAHMNSKLVEVNGMEAYDFTADCTADTDGYGPLRLHIF